MSKLASPQMSTVTSDGRAGHSSLLLYFLRGATPGPFFFTLGLREPRGSVRFGLGAAFLRAARFSFLRSSLSLMFFVFII
jgi:hypothetical protein